MMISLLYGKKVCKQGRDVRLLSFNHTLVIFSQFKIWPQNVRLKIVASGCDQCMWAVTAIAGYGHSEGY